MKNSLSATFNEGKIVHQGLYSDEIHVVDYTNRTQSKKAVNAHCIKPVDIETLKISNPTKVHVTISIFKPQCFMGDDGKELKQCECVIYPTSYTNDKWLVFIEIKDCKPKNIYNYFKDIKEKFIVNVGLFRDKGIIDREKVVYAIASFPQRNKTSFHSHMIKPPEVKKFLDKYKITIKGTNEIHIKNSKSII